MLIQFAVDRGVEALTIKERATIPERKKTYLLPGEKDQYKRDKI